MFSIQNRTPSVLTKTISTYPFIKKSGGSIPNIKITRPTVAGHCQDAVARGRRGSWRNTGRLSEGVGPSLRISACQIEKKQDDKHSLQDEIHIFDLQLEILLKRSSLYPLVFLCNAHRRRKSKKCRIVMRNR
jgi:hypothetical protein